MEQKVYLAPGAYVLGDVRMGEQVNIWYGAVLRGDQGAITIGANTNIQDNAVLHEKTTLGVGCTVGHGAIVHGCTVGNFCTVGMGAILLNGAVIGDNCMIGAGSVVTGKTVAPAGSLLLGNPAKVVRTLTETEIQHLHTSAAEYVAQAKATLPLCSAGTALE